MANRIMQENAEQVQENYHDLICDGLTKCGTRWHFSPPGAPHFNGLAEAAVKTVKKHLKRVIGDSILTYEELSTLLAQIEACVNSRPLCPISSDPNDIGVLTPAHFLVGESLVAPPEQCHIEAKASWLTRWQRVQQMGQYFWSRWSSDFLNQLQTRSNWRDQKKQPKLDDLVLIRDENLPPTKWQMGRIVSLHSGEDGLTRVVTLKTKNGLLKRPITKICPMPFCENDDPEETIKINANVSNIVHRSNTPRRRKSLSVLPLLTAILSLCITMSHQSPIKPQPYEISYFNTSPGIYFEKISDMFISDAHWNVMAFVSYHELREEFKTIQYSLSTAKATCYGNTTVNSGCKLMISHLEHRINTLGDKNSLLFMQGENYYYSAMHLVPE